MKNTLIVPVKTLVKRTPPQTENNNKKGGEDWQGIRKEVYTTITNPVKKTRQVDECLTILAGIIGEFFETILFSQRLADILKDRDIISYVKVFLSGEYAFPIRLLYKITNNR